MKKINLVFFILLIGFSLVAQDRNKVSELEENTSEEVRRYRELGGIGFGLISFRDLATSPLIYRGPALGLKLGKTQLFANKEYKSAINFSIGGAFSSVGEESSTGIVASTDISYSRLYNLKSLAFKGWDTKIGGAVDILFINRFNADLRNNSVGFEFFPTLFGSFKVGKDFSRHLLFRKKIGPRKQHFSVRIDVGLLNSNFRNGYAYTAHAPFYNGSNLFENHQFNVFSGIRFRSTIDYILYHTNTKNAIKISYTWDGVRSGENPDRFALSNGIGAFSFLYRLDSKKEPLLRSIFNRKNK